MEGSHDGVEWQEYAATKPRVNGGTGDCLENIFRRCT
jgi:hypothetical protein